MDKFIDASKEPVSLEEGRSGHSDESTEKRTSRKKRQGQNRRLALTVENVVNELKEVDWHTLCGDIEYIAGGVLELPLSQRIRIIQNFTAEDERRTAAVSFFLTNHPYASWRLLIWRLDWEEKHSLSERLHPYAEKLIDPSLTHENISVATASVEEDKLGDILWVPQSKREKIRQQRSNYRESVINYYILSSPYASWTWLAGRLYYYEEHEALSAVKKFIKGTHEPTLTLPNLNTVLDSVGPDWVDMWMWMDIPGSKLIMTLWQHSRFRQRNCECRRVYLTDHPSPSWQQVAYVLYHSDHIEELQVVQRIYLKGTAESRRQFEEAMKNGYIKAWLCKLLMYGAAGSGKTCFSEMIAGNQPPADRASTPLACRPTTIYQVNIDDDEFTKISTLQERKVFLARALNHTNLDLAATRHDNASSVCKQPPSTVAEFPVKSKDRASAELGKPPPLDDQPPLELVSVGHVESTVIEVDDILESISTEEELVKLMDHLSTTARKHPIAFFKMLRMIDCGGQPPFHELLPVFLRKLSFYLFVFRLCDELATHPVVEYYADGKPFSSPFVSAQSLEQLLQHCVRAMHSHRPSAGSERECPQIMVIGTHVDQKEKSKETVDEKNRKILKILSPLAKEQIIFHNALKKEVIFPVNAKAPGKDEDKIVEQVRRALLSTSSVRPAEIPSKWFALEILLEEMTQALQRGVLSKDEVITAAVEKLHFEEDAVDAALQYLDQLSVLFYYPQILPGVVFAVTQVLLDKLSELVFKSAEMENPSSEQSLGGEWIKFHESALITAEFLSKKDFSQHFVPGLFEVEDLIFLFKKLLIFATFANGDLFVPALLRHLTPKDVDKHRVSSLPSLVLRFPDGGPRQGIFCALLCWLVSPENDSPAPWTVSTDEFGTPLCLYRNCVQFDFPSSPVEVTLVDAYTHFEVHVDIPSERRDDVCPSIIFPVIQKVVFEGVRKASLNLCYPDSVPEPALVCPCAIGEAHVAIAHVKYGWTCTVNKKKGGPLSQNQLLWVDPPTSAISENDHTRCTVLHLPEVLDKLRDHASKWRDIGLNLGFRPGELDNIQARPFLQLRAPESWLRDMLTEWLQRASNDSRGSPSIENLQRALNKSRIGN